MPTLESFVRESNAIEGIHRDPTSDELVAHGALLQEHAITLPALYAFQAIIAPGKPLRAEPGMNVTVGNHVPPPGGPAIPLRLADLLDDVNRDLIDPWRTHLRFETLHPFMDGNGRTGRALWAWQMLKLGRDPFALPFLHRWYYQTLEKVDR